MQFPQSIGGHRQQPQRKRAAVHVMRGGVMNKIHPQHWLAQPLLPRIARLAASGACRLGKLRGMHGMHYGTGFRWPNWPPDGAGQVPNSHLYSGDIRVFGYAELHILLLKVR